jgi:peroxiredoxin
MAQLRHDYQKFVERNTVIIAIGPEDSKSFADWWHEHEMPFIGIADPEHLIAKKYGQQVKLLKLGRLPASFLIDKSGSIRYKHFGESMSDIPGNQEVLSLIDELNKEEPGKTQSV